MVEVIWTQISHRRHNGEEKCYVQFQNETVLQVKFNPMEQIKETEKIRMIDPIEWNTNHLEAHEKLNEAVTQFYWLFDSLIKGINFLGKIHEDAEDANFASFSKLRVKIDELKDEIKKLNKGIDLINAKLQEWWRFMTRRYEWILDTDTETIADLEPITDDDLKWRNYLANIVVNEAIPNQWTMTYSFSQTSLVHWEYKPRVYLMAKQWEHAVLEYDFTVILTEI